MVVVKNRTVEPCKECSVQKIRCVELLVYIGKARNGCNSSTIYLRVGLHLQFEKISFIMVIDVLVEGDNL